MPGSAPYWALALLFWIHMSATVTWLGSLVAMAAMVLPAAGRALQPADRLSLVDQIRGRLEPITWLSVSILIVTGLFQMSVNPHYDGFLSTSTQWSLAILIKHIFGIVMVVVSAIQTWEVIPAIRRAIIKSKKTNNRDEIDSLRRKEVMLLRTNFGLSLLILLATAFARAS